MVLLMQFAHCCHWVAVPGVGRDFLIPRLPLILFSPPCSHHLLLPADPGNVSVDASGRLIYYDMGMMGEVRGN